MIKKIGSKALEVFKKQIQKDKVSHAYLLVGDGSLEIAKEMAMMLVCESQSACQTCAACLKVLDNTYYDLEIIDGTKRSIKKEDILNIQKKFSQTSLEKSPYRIYILDKVENATAVALNSLLKFLEEPSPNIVAILTTSAEAQVLETIKSRCMMLTLESISKVAIEKELLDSGFDLVDAYCLANLCNSLSEAITYSETKDYTNLRNTLVELLSNLNRDKAALGCVEFQQAVGKEKTIERITLGELCFLMSLMLMERQNSDIMALSANISQTLKLKYVTAFTKARDSIKPGFNLSLIVDGLVFDVLYGERV